MAKCCSLCFWSTQSRTVNTAGRSNNTYRVFLLQLSKGLTCSQLIIETTRTFKISSYYLYDHLWDTSSSFRCHPSIRLGLPPLPHHFSSYGLSAPTFNVMIFSSQWFSIAKGGLTFSSKPLFWTCVIQGGRLLWESGSWLGLWGLKAAHCTQNVCKVVYFIGWTVWRAKVRR